MDPAHRVLSMIEALNAGDTAAAVAHFDAAVHNHGRAVGQAGMRLVFDAQRIAFPDWHHEVVQVVKDGLTAVTRSILSGTHHGVPDEPMVSLLFGGALRAWNLPVGRCGSRRSTSGRSVRMG